MSFWSLINFFAYVGGLGPVLKQRRNKGHNARKWHDELKFLWSLIEWILLLFNLVFSVAYFKDNNTIATTVTLNILLFMQVFYAFFFLTYGLFYRSNLRVLQMKYLKIGHHLFQKKDLKTHTGYFMKLVMLYHFVLMPLIFILAMFLSLTEISSCYGIIYFHSFFVSVPLVIVYSFIFESHVDYYEEELNRQIQAFDEAVTFNNFYDPYQQKSEQWRHIYYHLKKLNIFIERLFKFFGPLIAVMIAFYFIATTLTLYATFTISGFVNFLVSSCNSFSAILPLFYFTHRPTYIINLVSAVPLFIAIKSLHYYMAFYKCYWLLFVFSENRISEENLACSVTCRWAQKSKFTG